MKTVYHEAMHPLGNLGLKISMAALESPHIPMPVSYTHLTLPTTTSV